jgi:hypothetical protein
MPLDPFDWDKIPTVLWEAWASGLILGLIGGSIAGFLTARLLF